MNYPSVRKDFILFIIGILFGGFFLPSIIYRTSVLPLNGNGVELAAWFFWRFVFVILLTILFLPIFVWRVQRRSAQFSKKVLILSTLPIGLISFFVLVTMMKQNSSQCFSPFSTFGINPSYSIVITDQVLRDLYQIDAVLTRSRLDGNEIAFGDYSVGIGECQNAVKIKWKNQSSDVVIIKELPEKETIYIQPNQTSSYIFKAEGDYPYTMNGFPKIIHVGSARENFLSHKSDLENFCRRFARGDAQVMFRAPIEEDVAKKLIQSAGLMIERQEPGSIFLVGVPQEKTASEIKEILGQHPLFGNFFPDCSVRE